MVIGISGKKRSGKDTVGGIAVEWLWDNAIPAKQTEIADQLKREVAEVTGMSKNGRRSTKIAGEPYCSGGGLSSGGITLVRIIGLIC